MQLGNFEFSCPAFILPCFPHVLKPTLLRPSLRSMAFEIAMHGNLWESFYSGMLNAAWEF